jgi:tRNA U34 5-methylaminomethyl-2-thiouridine-forming methyltransferase MnmC
MADFIQALRLVITGDGSHSVAVGDDRVTFHSMHGAITESKHIFIGYGLEPALKLSPGVIRILEVGFGTGLNALLTLLESPHHRVYYDAIEPNPLPRALAQALNYPEFLGKPSGDFFKRLHEAPLNSVHSIGPMFQFRIRASTLDDLNLESQYDLVYFDPFDPEYQPELWSHASFGKLISSMTAGGILVTYSAKGQVRRTMQDVGFRTERLPGPPGKRHVTRATKPVAS